MEPQGDFLLPGGVTSTSRRQFLRLAGYGILGSALAGCSRGPTRHVVPFLSGLEGVVPGRAYWIATTCKGCAASCGVLAKCTDGRPIKLEGNKQHLLSQGGLCAVGQAQVLSLYDGKRASDPVADGVRMPWKKVDGKLRELLATTQVANGRVRVLTGTLNSPSTREALSRFLVVNGDAQHISYDPLSVSAILDAHEQTHGVRALPSYRFGEAQVVASFDADFLGTWISPVQFAADYSSARRPESVDGADARMSLHVQYEARMSLTGAAADQRMRIAPWEMGAVLAGLCEALEVASGTTARMAGQLGDSNWRHSVEDLAHSLWEHRGHSLVVCGVNDTHVQALANYANQLLGNYGKTLSVGRPSLQRSGNDAALWHLKEELEAGQVDVLIVSGVNPAYDLPAGFAAALSQAGTLVVHGDGLDETFAAANYGLPAAHFLESWDDAEVEVGRFDFTQPTIPALRSGRTLRQLLAGWMGDTRGDSELLRDYWRKNDPSGLVKGPGFEAAFDGLLHDGYVEVTNSSASEPAFSVNAVPVPPAVSAPAGLCLVLYPKIGILDGSHAHIPWLQELADPITKVTWDNYAVLSEDRAEELGVKLGDIVRVSLAGDAGQLELPVLVQRGQHDGVVAIALGYGRRGTDRFAGVGPAWIEGTPTIEKGETLGVNAAIGLAYMNGNLRTDVRDVSVEATGGHADLACTQDHHSLAVPEHLATKGGEVRDALLTADFATYHEHPEHALPHPHHVEADLWPADHEPKGHHWGMAVDLSACNGCSACTVSCQVENNVPVVGRDEVFRHREMTWLRIDRYFSGEADSVTAAHQPMFCQQCDNAPCESVCPVLATVHSSEGLNQQVYNRCVGTRYCANTCPYKVRRFNWFEYEREDTLQNHALNPDVTIRSRGVMEKCSFCAQRIQEAKSEAARRGVDIADGDIQAACQQSCPTKAIVFGDMNDSESEVSRMMARQRSYGVLTELNVKPSVRYLARIRNTKSEGEVTHG